MWWESWLSAWMTDWNFWSTNAVTQTRPDTQIKLRQLTLFWSHVFISSRLGWYLNFTSLQHVVCNPFCVMLHMNKNLPANADYFVCFADLPAGSRCHSDIPTNSSHLMKNSSNSEWALGIILLKCHSSVACNILQYNQKLYLYTSLVFKSDAECQWVGGFQYVSVHSPFVILQSFEPPRFSISCLRFCERQRQFCPCSFICSWEPLSLTPEAR